MKKQSQKSSSVYLLKYQIKMTHFREDFGLLYEIWPRMSTAPRCSSNSTGLEQDVNRQPSCKLVVVAEQIYFYIHFTLLYFT